jgi:predicted transcriptional regulator
VDCLATAVGLPASQVSMSMQRLTLLGAIKTQVGTCERCRKQRTVLKAA